MAGILGKIEKLVDTATTVNNIVNKVNSSGLLSGININNLTPDSIKSVGEKLQGSLQGQSDEIIKDLMGAVNVNEIQNLASSITPEEIGIEVPTAESLKAEAMNGIDMNQFMNIQGLEGISIM